MKQSVSKTTGVVAALALCLAAVGASGQMIPVAATNDGSYDQPGVSMSGDPQAKDELLDGLDRLGANAKERNEVNLDKTMLALAGGKKGGRYGDLAQKMDFIVVRNYEFASKGQYQKSDLDTLRHRLEGSGWSHVVRNESDGEINDIVVRADREGFISDMVIVNAEPKELNIVHLRGHFRLDDVQGAMGSAMGASMGAMGSAMGGAMGRVAAIPQPPVPPEQPALKKR
ncbi:MAG: DUF4252 domain-containing protein [Janthinobacterium lividum]